MMQSREEETSAKPLQWHRLKNKSRLGDWLLRKRARTRHSAMVLLFCFPLPLRSPDRILRRLSAEFCCPMSGTRGEVMRCATQLTWLPPR
jgi:hypothetical protein